MIKIIERIRSYINISELITLFIFATFSILISLVLPIEHIIPLALGIIAIISIIKFPEIGFALFLLIAVLKDFLQDNLFSSLGIDFTLILFFITSLGVCYKILSKDKYRLDIKNKYTLLYLGFGIILILSNLYTKSPRYGFSKTVSFLVFNSFLFFGGIFIASNQKSQNNFLIILQWMIFIYALIYVYFLKNLIGLNWRQLASYHLRLSLEGNPISVGRIFSILCVVSICKLFTSVNIKRKLFYIFNFIIALIIVVATNSRGPLLALIITILSYFLFFTHIKKWKVALSFAFIVFVFSIILSILPPSFTSRYKLFEGKEIHLSQKEASVFNTFKIRKNYVRQAIDYLVNNPDKIVIGSGVGSFSFISANKDITLYPHNIFIEILLEIGIVGIILFSLIFLLTAYDVILGKKYLDKENYDNIIIWISLLILFFINAQFTGDIVINRPLWFFVGGIIGFIILLKRNKKNEFFQF